MKDAYELQRELEDSEMSESASFVAIAAIIAVTLIFSIRSCTDLEKARISCEQIDK